MTTERIPQLRADFAQPAHDRAIRDLERRRLWMAASKLLDRPDVHTPPTPYNRAIYDVLALLEKPEEIRGNPMSERSPQDARTPR